jgi:hypothetical protein
MGLLVREQNGSTRILVEHGTIVQFEQDGAAVNL